MIEGAEEDPEELDVVIVGAGMSGLLMGIRLRQAGIERFRIITNLQLLP